MSRRDVEHMNRRQYILDAARRLFADQRVEEVGMEQIARAADYTRRTLYSYFRNRDEICLALHHADERERWALQRAAVEAATTGRKKLEAWALTLFEYVRDHPTALRLEAYWDYRGIDPDRIDPELFSEYEALNDELADGLRAIFNLGIADGSLRRDLRVDMCISQFLYALRAVIHRALSSGYSFAEFSPDDYLRHHLDTLSRGLRGRKD